MFYVGNTIQFSKDLGIGQGLINDSSSPQGKMLLKYFGWEAVKNPIELEHKCEKYLTKEKLWVEIDKDGNLIQEDSK